MESEITNKTALITGGSSGIGYAIANELAGRGFNLLLASNQREKLIEVKEEFSHRHQIDVQTMYLDLTENDAAQKIYDWCRANDLQIEVLVNNAGIFFFGEVAENSPDKVHQMISLHVETPALLCTFFSKNMKQSRSGHILNIASMSAFMPYPGIALYSATKTFLKSFSRSLRTEMIDYNVNVTCVLPGAVSTSLFEFGEKDRKRLIRMGVMMKPEKLAKKVVKGMFRRKSILIPGIINRLIIFLVCIIPHSIILLIRRYSKFLPPDKI